MGIAANDPVDRFTVDHARRRRWPSTTSPPGSASPPAEPGYTVRWAPFDNRTATPLGERAPVDAERLRAPIPADIWGPPDPAGIRYAVAALRR